MTKVRMSLVVTTAAMLAVSATAGAKVTLTMSLWMNSTEVKPTMALFAQYEKETGVKIKPMPNEYNSYLDKVLTMTATGITPDVMVLDRQWLPIFAQKHLIRPLDDVIKADGIVPKRDLSFWRSSYYGQKFYGPSIWGSPNLLFYYPEKFKEAGVASPYEYIAAGRWNWDTFVEAAAKMTKDTNGDGQKDAFGYVKSTWVPDWVGKILQAGGHVFSDDYSKVLVDQPAAIDGLRFWHDLAAKYGVSPQGNKGGKTAMFVEWLSTYGAWSAGMKPKPEMTIQPAGKAGYATVGGGCPVTISQTTKHFDEAYKFAKWFALKSDDWKTVGAPALRSTWTTDYQKYLSGFFEHPEVAQMALDNMDPEPAVNPRFRLIQDALDLNITRLANDKATPEQVASDLAKDLTRIISRK